MDSHNSIKYENRNFRIARHKCAKWEKMPKKSVFRHAQEFAPTVVFVVLVNKSGVDNSLSDTLIFRPPPGDFRGKTSQLCVCVLCRRSVQRCNKTKNTAQDMECVSSVCGHAYENVHGACMRPYTSVCVCIYVKGKEKVEALSHRWSPENKHEVQNTHTRVSYSRKVKDQVESNCDPSERST